MKKSILLLLLIGSVAIHAQAPVQNDPSISITMKASEWNVVVKALMELPYKETAGTLENLMAQAQTQMRAEQARINAKDTTQKKTEKEPKKKN